MCQHPEVPDKAPEGVARGVLLMCCHLALSNRATALANNTMTILLASLIPCFDSFHQFFSIERTFERTVHQGLPSTTRQTRSKGFPTFLTFVHSSSIGFASHFRFSITLPLTVSFKRLFLDDLSCPALSRGFRIRKDKSSSRTR
jgi:hypothetical protein